LLNDESFESVQRTKFWKKSVKWTLLRVLKVMISWLRTCKKRNAALHWCLI